VAANKGFFVASLTPSAESVTGQLAVVRRELRETRGGRLYLSLVLSDRTGRIEARDWDNAAGHEPVFAPGAIVRVRATVEEFNGQRQLKIERARACTEGEYNLADFVATSAYDVEEMYAALGAIVAGVADEPLRRLLELVLCRYSKEWRQSPAAVRNHHAFAGGLLEHTLSVCRAAHALGAHYARLDCDLLIAGCLLHDIGKMREIEAGLSIDMSAEGRLVGHIGEGLIMFEECCREISDFPEERRMLLRHMIVSHHGLPEYGALKRPMTPEAIVLNALDELDYKLECAFRAIDNATEAFSAWQKPMEREIYAVRCGPSAPAPDATEE
jgi:3'-5' exoribonuclease